MKTFIPSSTLLILLTISAQAQNNSPLQANYSHQFRNDDGSGSVAVNRWGLRGGLPLINKEDNLLAIGARYALHRYDFDGTTADWEAIHLANLGLASRWQLNEDWLLGNFAVIGISAEESSDKADGFNFNYISIAQYKWNDRLSIGPGVGISSQVDQDLSVFPIIAVNWQINDEWKFASGPSQFAPSGANVYVEFTPAALQEKWMFTGGFSYSSQNFKIADNATVIDGSGEERLASAYLAATYNMESGVRLNAIAGYNFLQSYSTFNNSGNELSKEILEDAPFLGVSVGFDF